MYVIEQIKSLTLGITKGHQEHWKTYVALHYKKSVPLQNQTMPQNVW